jgi:hypothetical protein
MSEIFAQATLSEIIGTTLFLFAILHTFSVKGFQRLAGRFPEGSVGENLFHLLGEVEVVFGLWAAIFLAFMTVDGGKAAVLDYLHGRNYTEPAFVFVILVICATRPILFAASALIEFFARLLPVNRALAFFWSAMVLGPLLGSFITEPAAMTISALLLLDRVLRHVESTKLKYSAMGLLFVNVSIGGTLTPYAAPPVLMVASTWNWDLSYMLANFGWKAAIAVVLSTSAVTFRFRRELSVIPFSKVRGASAGIPSWVILLHLVFLAAVVMAAHHMVVFIPLFLFFLGVVTVTREYQEQVRVREGLLVAFFLGGLVVLGGVQRWWLEPLLMQLSPASLYLSATALTAITDNAALTYLGAQVPGLSEAAKLALVAGAVSGGGLTVIANAPNPAGYGILNPVFGEEGIDPVLLFRAALGPTIVAMLCFSV